MREQGEFIGREDLNLKCSIVSVALHQYVGAFCY